MKSCVVIPARYKSSRLPGKPLVKLLGKPMIIWVAELSSKALGKENVFVATDDTRIAETVENSGFNVIMTSSEALTGTDRVAEAASKLDYDIVVNVQGDEPLVDPEDILQAIHEKKKNYTSVINSYNHISDSEDPFSPNIPKVVINESEKLVYISRSLIPGYKDLLSKPKKVYKQVCIYAFDKVQLSKFLKFGRKSYLELCEDIEILRFLEIDYEVKMFMSSNQSLAVDVESDIFKVEKALKIKYEN